MTSRYRFAAASLLAASLAFGFAACKPIDKDAKKEDKADATGKNDDIAKSTGLKTEKEQASYMVGMTIGKSLEPIKDEVDVDTLMKAVKTSLSGGKPLLNDAAGAAGRAGPRPAPAGQEGCRGEPQPDEEKARPSSPRTPRSLASRPRLPACSTRC